MNVRGEQFVNIYSAKFNYLAPYFLLILTCALFTPEAKAEKLSDLFYEVLQQNPDIRGKRNELEAAGADLSGAKWNLFPNLSFQSTNDSTQIIKRSLNIQQPLWQGGRLSGKIDQSQAQLELARGALIEVEQNAMRDASVAYLDIGRFSARLEVAKVNEMEHRRLLGIIGRRVAADISPMADQVQAQARLQQAVSERLQIEKSLESARFQLEQLVGRRVLDASQLPSIPMSVQSFEMVSDTAIGFSPEIKRLEAAVRSAEADIDLARAQLAPQLSLGYRQLLGAPIIGYEKSQTYISLQAQTGGGLSSMYAIKAAQDRQMAAKDRVTTQQRLLLQQVQSAISDIRLLGMQVEPASQLLENTTDIVDSYLRQFQVGRRTWLEVLNAQREKVQAAYSLLDIKYPLVQAKIRLLLLEGLINSQEMGVLND